MRGRRIVRDPETLVALALAALAAARVLFLSLAFPFFTNVDEFRHVDMAQKYARGYEPGREGDAYEPETLRLVAILGSPEYHRDPRRTSPAPAPIWRSAPDVLERRLARVEASIGPIHNLEANQSPVYYSLAGAWLRVGRALGLGGGPLLYWLRALSAPATFLLVLVSFAGLRAIYVRSRFVRLGVPALLAFLPQDCVTYVTSDALAPFFGGMAFLGCIGLALRPQAGSWRGAATGLVLAAAILTKLPNALFGLVALYCGAASRRARRAAGRAADGCWPALWLALAAPVGAWLIRNQVLLGDATGDAVKIERLGWGRRPLAEWFSHPLFGPEGLGSFLAGLVHTFWRGEIAWRQVPLAHSAADGLYLAATALCLALAAVGMRDPRPREERVAEAAAWVAVLTAIGILGWLSLRFAYGPTTNPSVEQPWFANGRLVAGAMLPFALLFVRGIERGVAWLPERCREPAAWAALSALLAAASLSEAILTAPVTRSAYNFFHLP
jgi:hypothetical protein